LAYRLSIRYLNPRPRYYYFRFVKTNGRHIEILLPISTVTFSLSSASANQILCKFGNRRRSYDIVLIIQDGGYSVANLLPVSVLATSHT